MGRGTGPGLATVYRIVKPHKRFIDVDSIRRKGTAFRVYPFLGDGPARTSPNGRSWAHCAEARSAV
jgi:hypothetical protein